MTESVSPALVYDGRSPASTSGAVSPNTAPTVAAPSAQHPVRRAHIVFSDPKAYETFLSVWKRQSTELSNVRMLAQLLEELEADQRKVDGQLLNQYGIQPDRQYRYDVSQSTIFEVSPDRPSDQPRVHQKLSSEASRREFSALLARKESLRLQLQGLSLLIRDRRELLESLRKQLASEYAISRDREYDVDEDAKTVWETIPRPIAVQSTK